MSTVSESGINLEDLERHFLPAWARQSPTTNRYAKYEGVDEAAGARRRDRREPRGGPRPDRRPDRRPGEAGGVGRPFGNRPRGPRREGGRGAERRREERREPVVPLPEVGVAFVPDEKGVESLARQIKLTGRAYPMFEIGQLVLRKPDRYHVTFSVLRKPDGAIAQQLWLCNLDDTLWLNEAEAVAHVLRKHFDAFYQADKTPTDPPKGTYTFVAQCSLSGVILGPPNFHDYQVKLHKLHASRFARMPFEVYKARIRIVRDEATVKQWLDEQSWKTEYVCLNVPESVKLTTREEVENHFREVHQANIIRTVESWTLSGPSAQALPSPILRTLLRRAWEDQQRFPLRVVHTLSQQFAAHGLQFFKVNKTVTHVSVARPHYLDLSASPVSENIRRIVGFIDATPGCTRKRLLESLAPTPASDSPAPSSVPLPPPIGAAGNDGSVSTEAATAAPPATPAEQPKERQPTPEQTALISDLHWLIHQGHVIEFANGKLETAKKPKPKPPPAPRPVAPPTDSVSEATRVAEPTAGAADADAQAPGDPAAVPAARSAPSEEPTPNESLTDARRELPPAPIISEPPADGAAAGLTEAKVQPSGDRAAVPASGAESAESSGSASGEPTTEAPGDLPSAPAGDETRAGEASSASSAGPS